MTKYLFFISLSLSFFNSIYASDIEVIELHNKKSLDQLVLEEANDSDEVIEENDISLESTNNSDQISEEEISND